MSINEITLTLNLSVQYNEWAGYWTLNIKDSFNNPLISSIPLLTGYWPASNILMPYSYLQIGRAFLLNTTGGASDWPDNTNLSQFLLLWDSN